jgi:hypothetical protein
MNENEFDVVIKGNMEKPISHFNMKRLTDALESLMEEGHLKFLITGFHVENTSDN